MAERQYLSVAEASARLCVHPNTLRNWERAGTIRMVHLPGSKHRRVPATEVERLLQAMATPGDAAPMIEPPPTDVEGVAAGRALAAVVKGQLALAADGDTLEECMATLRGRSWF